VLNASRRHGRLHTDDGAFTLTFLLPPQACRQTSGTSCLAIRNHLQPNVPSHGRRRLSRERGTIEHAQQVACDESPKTTKLDDRTSDQITLDEVDWIVI
jgi:hypothetical protein